MAPLPQLQKNNFSISCSPTENSGSTKKSEFCPKTVGIKKGLILINWDCFLFLFFWNKKLEKKKLCIGVRIKLYV